MTRYKTRYAAKLLIYIGLVFWLYRKNKGRYYRVHIGKISGLLNSLKAFIHAGSKPFLKIYREYRVFPEPSPEF